ncbi:DNA-binding transcriptional LysR family regulator [Bradyrhizobium sp. GM5.1]
MMTLRQVEVIRAVMVTGTIGGAAKLLNVSAPGISRLVKYTERSLGIRFFQRQNGRYFPTPEAENIFEQINGVYKKVDDLSEIISKIGRGGLSELRIGSVPSISQVMVPRAIERVRRRYPDLGIDINILKLEEAIDYLMLGRGECVAMSYRLEHSGLDFMPLASGELYCIVPPGHELAGRKQVSAAEITRYPLIGIDPNDPYRADHGRDLRAPPPRVQHHHPRPLRHHGLRAGEGGARHRHHRPVHGGPWGLSRHRADQDHRADAIRHLYRGEARRAAVASCRVFHRVPARGDARGRAVAGQRQGRAATGAEEITLC